VSGTQLIIDPTSPLATDTMYAVQIDSTAVEDLAGNGYLGINDTTTWSFTTAAPDTTDPTLQSTSPPNGEGNVLVDSNLEATFSEAVMVGTGNITLVDLTNGPTGNVVIDVTDASQISIDGAVLTIDPAANLVGGTTYAVQIDATAIDDLVGNGFAGFTDTVTWTFSTPTPPPPNVLFYDGFEAGENVWGGTTPDVEAADSTGNTSGQANGTLWIRADQGFGSTRAGLVDESSGQFTDPGGEQAYAFRYTNSGLTTAEGLIGSLTAGTTYTVTFDVMVDGENAGDAYRASLVTFNGGARNDVRNNAGATSTLVTMDGDATSAAYETVTLSYTADGSEAGLGHDVAIRFFGFTTSANIDNVQVEVIGDGGSETGSTFAEWIGGFGVGDQTGFDDDFDGDGIGNALENYMGTDPSVFSGGLSVTASEDGSFTFEHPLGDNPAVDLSAGYRWSGDLDTFHPGGVSANGTTVDFVQGATVGGMVEVTATVSGTPLEVLFVVLEVTQN
jgi:hypothetical protein